MRIRRRYAVLAMLLAVAGPACELESEWVVDLRQPGPALAGALNGGHIHDQRPTEGQLALGLTAWRRVASAANRVSWDCSGRSLAPETIAEYHDWLDAVQEAGVEPFIALAYVPECLSEGGHPKAPPVPGAEAGYRAFAAALLDELVAVRVAQGKEPLRHLEVWNEPDIPFDGGNVTHGHGWVGTLDDFAKRVFVPLGREVMAVEARTGVDVRLGVAASFDSRPLSEAYPTLESLLLAADVPPGLAATVGPIAERTFDALLPEGFDRRWGRGGFAWSDRLLADAARLGIEVDFVSWHHYVQNPFEGPGPACMFPELLGFLQRRNPLANVSEYRDDGLAWGRRYPGKELFVTEWDVSAGCDDRPAFEVAAFHAAALIAMQQGGVTGAMQLGFPESGPRAIAHWMFAQLAGQTVGSTLAEDEHDSGVWALASIDDERLTLFAAQWHSFAEDARDRVLDVVVEAVPPGAYEMRLHRIDREHAGSFEPDAVEALSVGADGKARARLPLAGQAVAFAEIRPR